MLKCRSKEQEILDLHVVTPAYNAPAPIFVRSHYDSAHQAPSMHYQPTMNILCPRTNGVRSAPLQQMKFERSTRIHQIGSCCVETEASQFTKWNRETIFVDIYHERREKYMCKKNGKYYNVGVGTDDLAISCQQSCAIRQYHIFNDAMCASVWLEM